MKPRLLDLFCGAGGAAMGYHRAGFEVVGVDIKAQPNYPFAFKQGDALALMHARFWDQFDAIHASPPCQAFTTMSVRWRNKGTLADKRENLIPATRELLEATELPYVIENVVGAKSQLRTSVCISGPSVGLPRIERRRLFETNWLLLVPEFQPAQDPIGIFGRMDNRRLWTRADGSLYRSASNLGEAREAMGIDWMTWNELREAIPPAYTELIGHQLMQHVKAEAVA